MNKTSNDRTKRLACTSLILGILSLVLIILPFLTVQGVVFGESDVFTDYLFSLRGHLFWPRSMIFSLLGCLFAIVAIKKHEREDDNKAQKKHATSELIFNGVLTVIALFLHLMTPILSFPNLQTIPNNLLP